LPRKFLLHYILVAYKIQKYENRTSINQRIKTVDLQSKEVGRQNHLGHDRDINHFGLCDPLLVNCAPERKNIVIGGHLRLKVAPFSTSPSASGIFKHPEIEREQELNLRLNKNLGNWDEELLKAFDTGMLMDVGFNR